MKKIEIKVLDYTLSNWEKWINTYVRAIYIGDVVFKNLNNCYYASGPIGHPQIRLYLNKYCVWCPIFCDKLQFLQEIYNNEVIDNNIDFMNLEKTQLYVDSFVIKYIDKINKLIVFS